MQRRIQLLTRGCFPSHTFFDHLLRGTEFYRHKDFESAAEEWGAAGWLNYRTPINLKRIKGRIFCGGYIREVPFLFFLYAIFTNKADGVGAIKTNGISKNLVFNEGRLVRAGTTRPDERIGNFILRKERLSVETLDLMVRDAREQGKRIGQYLVERGLLSLDGLQEILSLQIEQILIDILLWQQGYFYFLEKPIAKEVIVDYDPLKFARIATSKGLSFVDFRARISSPKIIFRPSSHAEARREAILPKLNENYKFIFSLIDGTRNIKQIARFSGIDTSAAINILYQLNTAGLIRQSKEIIEYEDKEYREISKVLDTLLEIFATISKMLFAELGAKAEELIQRSQMVLSKRHQDMFSQIAFGHPERIAKKMILRNISKYYPDPGQRHVFIEAFVELFENLLQEIRKYLGRQLTVTSVEKIKSEIKNVERYAKETALRSHLLETFDKYVY